MIHFTPPWQQHPLDQWYFGSMNHYEINGEKRLFVLMTKDDTFIKAEGPDNRDIWADLYTQAMKYET